MSRLVATMGWDVRLQVRNGFYYAAGFVALFMVLLLLWPGREDLAWILPFVVFSNLMINTFYFFSGLVLLEKREGTLEAQVVTPLRTWEYLGSKLVTLSALALAENLAITVFAYGFGFRILPFVLGMMLAAVICCLVGFALVACFRTSGFSRAGGTTYTRSWGLWFCSRRPLSPSRRGSRSTVLSIRSPAWFRSFCGAGGNFVASSSPAKGRADGTTEMRPVS